MAISEATIHKFTFEDFERMAEVGVLPERGLELVDGIVIEMSPKGDRHWYAVTALAGFFGDMRAERFVVSTASLTLRLGPNDSREPDLVLSRGSLTALRQRPRAEDIALLVEVADSSLSHDMGEKKKAYATVGIPEYWVIDVVHETAHVFRGANRFDGSYLNESAHDRTAVIAPAEFPEVLIDLARVFRPR